jgi:hypothetical protein
MSKKKEEKPRANCNPTPFRIADVRDVYKKESTPVVFFFPDIEAMETSLPPAGGGAVRERYTVES